MILNPFLVTKKLVKIFSTFPSSTEAAQLDILDGKLIVVGELLTGEDLPEGEDDDVLLAQDVDNLAVAVGLEKKRQCRKERNVSEDKILTSHEWLMNLAALPLTVASRTTSSSTLNM